jgi:hypothetical protein
VSEKSSIFLGCLIEKFVTQVSDKRMISPNRLKKSNLHINDFNASASYDACIGIFSLVKVLAWDCSIWFNLDGEGFSKSLFLMLPGLSSFRS